MQSKPENTTPLPFLTWQQRLRQNAMATLTFAALAVFINSTLNLFGSGTAQSMQEHGVLVWLGRWLSGDIFSSVVVAFVVLGCLRLSAERASDIARRPWRFILILAVSAALGTLLVWLIAHPLGRANMPSNMLRIKLFNVWQQIMYCGTLFGWLYVLYLRRTEDQIQFALLLSKRSLLKRQMAHAHLLATRAKIEPELVARVLRETRMRYLTAPQQAAHLLDHMIAYLRLAMNRVRDQNSTLHSELTLWRSYLALREAEMGQTIRFELLHGAVPPRQKEAAPLPVFLILQNMLVEALAACAPSIGLRLSLQENSVQFQLATAAVALSADSLARLNANINQMIFSGTAILLPTCDSGEYLYVVQIDFHG